MPSQNQQSNNDSAPSGNSPAGGNSSSNTSNNNVAMAPSTGPPPSNATAPQSHQPAPPGPPEYIPPHARRPAANAAPGGNSSSNTTNSNVPVAPSSGPAPDIASAPPNSRPAPPSTAAPTRPPGPFAPHLNRPAANNLAVPSTTSSNVAQPTLPAPSTTPSNQPAPPPANVSTQIPVGLAPHKRRELQQAAARANAASAPPTNPSTNIEATPTIAGAENSSSGSLSSAGPSPGLAQQDAPSHAVTSPSNQPAPQPANAPAPVPAFGQGGRFTQRTPVTSSSTSVANMGSTARQAPTAAAPASAPSPASTTVALRNREPAATGTSPRGDKSTSETKRPTFFDAKYFTSSKSEIGTKGDTLPIRVNRFAITTLPKVAYVYSVALPTISGRETKNPDVRKAMLQSIMKRWQPWAAGPGGRPANMIFTDWTDTLVITEKPQSPWNTSGANTINFEFRNQSNPTSQTLVASVTLVRSLEGDELDKYVAGNQPPEFNFGHHTNVLNMMVRHFASRNAVTVGKNRLFQIGDHGQLRSPLRKRLGFHNSVRPARKAVYLQLNASATAFFPDEELVPFLQKFFKGNFDPSSFNKLLLPDIRALTRQLAVRYTYITADDPQFTSGLVSTNAGRRKHITGYGKPAREQATHIASITVERHYLRTYNCQLKFPGLPAVNVGSQDSPSWIPMELLRIAEHQPLRGMIPQDDMDSMAELSRRNPMDNADRILNEGLALLEMSKSRGAENFAMNLNMVEVNARRLPVPVLDYLNAAKVHGQPLRDGKWTIAKVKFREAKALEHLLAIRVSQAGSFDKHSLLEQGLMPGLKATGVGVPSATVVGATSSSIEELNAAYDRPENPAKPKVVLVIINNKKDQGNQSIYDNVKRWGDIHKGVHTICLTRDKVGQLTKLPFRANLALKFNAKLGGINHRLSRENTKALGENNKELTMILGADVSHPSTSSIRYCPSIAAVVASTDRDCTSFPGSMRLQAGRTEMIVDMRAMVLERLKVWCGDRSDRKQTKPLPAKILFYRDGVGEDQYAMVMDHELVAIRAACADAAKWYNQPDYAPKITLVICTKRHHTRFFPPKEIKKEHRTHYGDKDRFKPGLVVDAEPVRLPKYFDFFLQSQMPLQGTARPCHYFVLANEMELTADQLQLVTFHLSYMYATALTPVSMAAPAYYAHKLCERGRCYIRPLLNGRHALCTIAEDEIPAALYGQQSASDEVKSHLVARHFSTGAGGFWPGKAKNPCHANVEDSMFYI